MTFAERYEKHVVRYSDDGCWGWSGPVLKTGYGYFNHPNEAGKWCNHRATHAAWKLFRGERPTNLFVLHRCDNPICSNPEHLFLGTHADNMRDMLAKGRGRKAANPAPRKTSSARRPWSEAEVDELRRLMESGDSDENIAGALGRPINSVQTKRINLGIMRKGNYRHLTLAERYEKHVIRRGDDECWGWSGSLAQFGYGALAYRDADGKPRNTRASRAAYQLFCGEIPEGHWVLHRCDNPVCSNPKHLFLGTPLDNVRDMDAKDRNRRSAKLTQSQVADIRQRLLKGESQRRLADHYELSRSAVWKIANNLAWIEGASDE